jgi:hypothetical protein
MHWQFSIFISQQVKLLLEKVTKTLVKGKVMLKELLCAVTVKPVYVGHPWFQSNLANLHAVVLQFLILVTT